jgi:hypothetical protein
MSKIEAIPACEPHFSETSPYLVVNNIYTSGAMIGPSSHVPISAGVTEENTKIGVQAASLLTAMQNVVEK